MLGQLYFNRGKKSTITGMGSLSLGTPFGLPNHHYIPPPPRPKERRFIPREMNLEMFQRSNTPDTIKERFKQAKMSRFYNLPLDPFDKQYQTTNAVFSPFPNLEKPIAPPYPLPALEGSLFSCDIKSSIDIIPKTTSEVNLSSEARKYDAKKLDYERKHMALLNRKVATTSMEVPRKVKRLIKKPPEQLAQQAHNWASHLRNYSPPKHRISSKTKKVPTQMPKDIYDFGQPRDFDSRPSSNLPILHDSSNKIGSISTNKIGSKTSQIEGSMFSKFDGISDVDLRQNFFFDQKPIYFYKPPFQLRPNLTAREAEVEYRRIHHRQIREIFDEKLRFPQSPGYSKFYVKYGTPVPRKPFEGNTFREPGPLLANMGRPGYESRRPRKYVLNLEGFKDKELTFTIAGSVISITGNHPRVGLNPSKNTVESCKLGTGLDLNRIIITRDFSGRIILEELWKY